MSKAVIPEVWDGLTSHHQPGLIAVGVWLSTCRCPSPQPGSHAAGGGDAGALQKPPVLGVRQALAQMAALRLCRPPCLTEDQRKTPLPVSARSPPGELVILARQAEPQRVGTVPSPRVRCPDAPSACKNYVPETPALTSEA